jgi:dienelactone hydrolase
MTTKIKTIVLLLIVVLSGCAAVPTSLETLKVEHINTPRPTVIIASGCDGNKNQSYTNWMKLVSSWGYNGVMMDSFETRNYPFGVCTKPSTVHPSVRVFDIEELANYIKQQSWHKGKIAVVGFSHGGSTIMNIANNSEIKNIDAGVAYYPSCNVKVWFGKRYDFIGRPYSNPKIPVQIHFGEKDTWTPFKECTGIDQYEHYTYKNATHAFDMQLPNRTAYGYYMEYNSEADRISKIRTKEFLDKNLVANK